MITSTTCETFNRKQLMKLYLLLLGCIFLRNIDCTHAQSSQGIPTSEGIASTAKLDTLIGLGKAIAGFLPAGYVSFEQVYGDLNNDGVTDCVVIIKDTEKGMIINDEYRGTLDRNRRGIIILFDQQGQYELALMHEDCFSSENEDGGVYFAPELSVSIGKGNLYCSYGHGRYGSWAYTFRYRNGDFELIGYDQSDNFGPVINKETSINFLTKKKLECVNTNEDADGGDEVFEETWSSIDLKDLIKLSEIKDFDALDMSY